MMIDRKMPLRLNLCHTFEHIRYYLKLKKKKNDAFHNNPNINHTELSPVFFRYWLLMEEVGRLC